MLLCGSENFVALFEYFVQFAYVMWKSPVWSIINNCLFMCIIMDRVANQRSIMKMSFHISDWKIHYANMLFYIRFLFSCLLAALAFLMQGPLTSFFHHLSFFLFLLFLILSFPLSSVPSMVDVWMHDLVETLNVSYIG